MLKSVLISATAALALLVMPLIGVRSASADVTIVTQVSVSGLTSQSNGNEEPPSFPLTFTTYFQGDKSRLESSAGDVLIFDNSANTVYQLDMKAGTYRVGSIKQLEDFGKVFPPRLEKRLTEAEDLNFFPDPTTANYLNTLTTQSNVSGAAHFFIQQSKIADDDSAPPGQNAPDGEGGSVGSDNTSGPSGLPMADPPIYLPGGGTSTEGLPGDDGATDQPEGGGSNQGTSDQNGDNSPTGSTPPDGDSNAPKAPPIRRSSVPDFFVSGSLWVSPAVKLPKLKGEGTLALALQMLWAGGPFVADLVKQLDSDREVPLHSEFSIKELYPDNLGVAAVLLNCDIKTRLDVTSVSSSPCDPALFVVPHAYVLDKSPIFIPQIAAPYVSRTSEAAANGGGTSEGENYAN